MSQDGQSDTKKDAKRGGAPIREFDFNIYPWKLWVVCGAGIEEQRRFFNTDKVPDWEKYSDAETFQASRKLTDGKWNDGVLIRFRKKAYIKEDLICHEAGHAALVLFNYFGCKAEYSNQEPFCYLLGFIAECCSKAKKGK